MPAWSEARRAARENLSGALSSRHGIDSKWAHTIEDMSVSCFFCGEKRVSRLCVTVVDSWGPAYKCQDQEACEESQEEW